MARKSVDPDRELLGAMIAWECAYVTMENVYDGVHGWSKSGKKENLLDVVLEANLHYFSGTEYTAEKVEKSVEFDLKAFGGDIKKCLRAKAEKHSLYEWLVKNFASQS